MSPTQQSFPSSSYLSKSLKLLQCPILHPNQHITSHYLSFFIPSFLHFFFPPFLGGEEGGGEGAVLIEWRCKKERSEEKKWQDLGGNLGFGNFGSMLTSYGSNTDVPKVEMDDIAEAGCLRHQMPSNAFADEGRSPSDCFFVGIQDLNPVISQVSFPSLTPVVGTSQDHFADHVHRQIICQEFHPK